MRCLEVAKFNLWSWLSKVNYGASTLASSAGNSVISVTSVSQSSVISTGSLCSVWAGGLRGRVTRAGYAGGLHGKEKEEFSPIFFVSYWDIQSCLRRRLRQHIAVEFLSISLVYGADNWFLKIEEQVLYLIVYLTAEWSVLHLEVNEYGLG
jgi:hypothetical protein